LGVTRQEPGTLHQTGKLGNRPGAIGLVVNSLKAEASLFSKHDQVGLDIEVASCTGILSTHKRCFFTRTTNDIQEKLSCPHTLTIPNTFSSASTNIL
jgi:hypothetical protein